MLNNFFTCPKCLAINTLVWRLVRLEHAEDLVKDELEAIEIACTKCKETVSILPYQIIKKS